MFEGVLPFALCSGLVNPTVSGIIFRCVPRIVVPFLISNRDSPILIKIRRSRPITQGLMEARGRPTNTNRFLVINGTISRPIFVKRRLINYTIRCLREICVRHGQIRPMRVQHAIRMVFNTSTDVGLSPDICELFRITSDRRFLVTKPISRPFPLCKVGASRTTCEYLTIFRRVLRVQRQIGMFPHFDTSRLRIRIESNQDPFVATRNGSISLFRQRLSKLRFRITRGHFVHVLVLTCMDLCVFYRKGRISVRQDRSIKVHRMGNLSMSSIRRYRTQRVAINGTIGQFAYGTLHLSIRSIIGVIQAGFSGVNARRGQGVGEETRLTLLSILNLNERRSSRGRYRCRFLSRFSCLLDNCGSVGGS